MLKAKIIKSFNWRVFLIKCFIGRKMGTTTILRRAKRSQNLSKS